MSRVTGRANPADRDVPALHLLQPEPSFRLLISQPKYTSKQTASVLYHSLVGKEAKVALHAAAAQRRRLGCKRCFAFCYPFFLTLANFAVAKGAETYHAVVHCTRVAPHLPVSDFTIKLNRCNATSGLELAVSLAFGQVIFFRPPERTRCCTPFNELSCTASPPLFLFAIRCLQAN